MERNRKALAGWKVKVKRKVVMTNNKTNMSYIFSPGQVFTIIQRVPGIGYFVEYNGENVLLPIQYVHVPQKEVQ